MKNVSLLCLVLAAVVAIPGAQAGTPLWACVGKITQPKSEVEKSLGDLASEERLLVAFEKKDKSYQIYFFKKKAQQVSLHVGTQNISESQGWVTIGDNKSKSGAWSLEISPKTVSYMGEKVYQASTFQYKVTSNQYSHKLYCVPVKE